MGELVVNNIVKMEWQKSGWLQTSSAKGKRPVFIFASHVYDSSIPELGKVTVYFTATTAFLIESDEGLWSAEELIPVVKKDFGGTFPYDLDEYVPIIYSGEEDCSVSVLEKYGLLEHQKDIEARMKDVAPYGVEEDFSPRV